MTLPEQVSGEHEANSTARLLAATAAVANRLNSGQELEESIPGVIETLRRALRADECVLWLQTESGLQRGWSAGEAITEASHVAAALAAGGENAGANLYIVPLDSIRLRLGVLSARRATPLPGEERLLLSTLANMLAPLLAGAEHSRQLEAEVDLRARQIDEQRRFTAMIIDSLPVGLYVIDKEYRVQAWNKKRETGLQGVSRDDALGRPIFDILHRQAPTALRSEFDEVFESGAVQQFNTESVASGHPRYFRVSKIPMRLDGGDVTHVITIGEDITDWKEAMDRFSQADKLAAIGQLAAGVMHEINNPLATIAACSESLTLLVDDMKSLGYAMTKEFGEYLRIIESEVQRCKRIVDGLLDFSHPKAVTKELVPVREVIEQAVFLIKHHAKFKRVAVVRQLAEGGVDLVSANRDQLVQVFMALLVNGADAVGEVGKIIVRTRAGRRSGKEIVAEVVDGGHGIARSDIPKIFEPFYTTKAPGRGTGLGLSICYGIVTEHGGRLEVDSAPGSGSVFRVILPLAQEVRA